MKLLFIIFRPAQEAEAVTEMTLTPSDSGVELASPEYRVDGSVSQAEPEKLTEPDASDKHEYPESGSYLRGGGGREGEGGRERGRERGGVGRAEV